MTKGIVYGGVAYLPVHPQADMHGLVRIIVRTKSAAHASLALSSFAIPKPAQLFNCRVWGESKSAAEQQATEGHYGEVLVCSLQEAYLNAAKYIRIPKGMKNG